MKIQHLQDALDRYGGDLALWPAALRAEAEALAASDAMAAKAIAIAASLDRLLAEAARPMTVDAALIGRIISGIDRANGHAIVLRPNGRLVAWAGAAMIAFLVSGFAAGVALPQSQGEDAFAGLMFGNSTTASASDTADEGSVL